MTQSVATIAVCIPVRDERALLPSLLDALDQQTGVDLARVCICFFFDGCEDDGYNFVRKRTAGLAYDVALAMGPRLPKPNAGRARSAAMAVGLAHVARASGGLLLTTDADSEPHADWLSAACRALQTADIVAGRIVRDGGGRDPVQTRIEAYFDRLYALRRSIDPVDWEPVDCHHFTGGANLGFRASAYQALGGFAPRASGEDALMIDDAGRAGLRVSRDARVLVTTSSRRDGRAMGGLASALAVLDSDGAADPMALVTHPADAAWQWHAQARARAWFDRLTNVAACSQLASAIGLTPDHVLGVARDCPNAEAFAMRIVPTVPGGERHVPLQAAERVLASLESDWQAAA